MDEDVDSFIENKYINRAKSCSEATQSLKLSPEAQKRKPSYSKEPCNGFESPSGRLKKSKLVEESYSNASRPVKRGSTVMDMFKDTRSAMCTFPSVEDPSVLSMNFSHYELMRNLSRANCNSEDAFSGTAGNLPRPTDTLVKDEHLEKYFRSVEMWRNYKKRGGACSSYHETP